MDKAYDHHQYEDTIYKNWEQSGKMRADEFSEKPPFTIPLPPPNITGELHLGHAAMLAIEDILIRYKRMTGHEVLWLPGTDHAAIATENVVLKHLGAKSREEYGREEFLDKCRQFTSVKHDTIVEQMKRMGAWLDWSREAYTFDEERSQAVNMIFKQLYDDGLVERGHRMVNWSTGAQSVLSDDELEWEEKVEPFYYIRCGKFVIGTARSETKCANSPVIVNPDGEYLTIVDKEGDELILSAHAWENDTALQVLKKNFREKSTIMGHDLAGEKFSYQTYAGERQFWVLADHVIDMEKGTGAMSISAAHSEDDYEMATRLNLKELFFTKIDKAGKMTDIAGPCQGMTVVQARKKSAEIMRDQGTLLAVNENYNHRVPTCYRSNCVVEPMISSQWFVMVDKEFPDPNTKKPTTLKKILQNAVRENHVKIIPEYFEKTYFSWVDNLRDWCISRQIWWGHRVPVWYDSEGNIAQVGNDDTSKSLYIMRHGESQNNAASIISGLKSNPALTEFGRRDIEKAAEKIRGKNITRILASPLSRAQETAKIIAKKLNLSVETWEDLCEASFGDLEGKTYSELGFKKGDVYRAVMNNKAGNREFLIERAQKLWEKFSAFEGDTLIVTHGVLAQTLEAVKNNLSSDEISQQSYWENGEVRSFPLSAVNDNTTGKTFTFVRHAESIANIENRVSTSTEKLSPLGEQQAQELANILETSSWDRVICSPYLRARQTIAPFAEKHGIKVEIWDELHELDYKELKGFWPDFEKTYNVAPGESIISEFREKGLVESFSSISERVRTVVKKLQCLPEENILIVGHGDWIKTLQSLLLQKPFSATTDPKNTEILPLFIADNFAKNSTALVQDTDTLDTWFSSALWPFSTLGWDGSGKDSADFSKFYPTDVLETGHDIIFFWVARMIMFGYYATGKYPFHTSYLHGLVTDEKGKKMSKSKGNGINPLEVIDEVGADAVRLSLVIGTTPGNKIPIGKNKIKGYRNFVNKLWNAGRFVQMQTQNIDSKSLDQALTPQTLTEKWIFSRFSSVCTQVQTHLEKYEISAAGTVIYHFVWDEFCAWYLESSKVKGRTVFLREIFAKVLRLTHPLCPFITETLWQNLDYGASIMDEEFPQAHEVDNLSEQKFQHIQALVGNIRNNRASHGINPKDKLSASITGAISEEEKALLETFGVLDFSGKIEQNSAKISEGEVSITLALPVNEGQQKKEKEALEKSIAMLRGRLSNEKYVTSAPKNVVDQTRENLAMAEQKLQSLK